MPGQLQHALAGILRDTRLMFARVRDDFARWRRPRLLASAFEARYHDSADALVISILIQACSGLPSARRARPALRPGWYVRMPPNQAAPRSGIVDCAPSASRRLASVRSGCFRRMQAAARILDQARLECRSTPAAVAMQLCSVRSVPLQGCRRDSAPEGTGRADRRLFATGRAATISHSAFCAVQVTCRRLPR